MVLQLSCWLLLLADICGRTSGVAAPLSPFLRHYEGLSYDRDELHDKHLRAKRASDDSQYVLKLDFTAYKRAFRLRLRRSTEAFSQNFRLIRGSSSESADLSHIYSGALEGENGSACHGSVLQGQFEGTIYTEDGAFHIEPLHRYTSRQTDHHSIIYHQDDLVPPSTPTASDEFCGTERLNRLTQTLKSDEEAATSRSRRNLDESKTSCLLHIHADHHYYLKFKSVEAVVAQVASYIRAVNDIYDKVDFDGIRLVNFKVKSLRVMTEKDGKDPLNPLYIGAERLLSLYSENNFGNFCLSFLLTNRDYSGLLGLAWEGKPGNWGGVCSKYVYFQKRRPSTLNTGLITIQIYGRYMPARQVQLTFAHELGHSLGAPHDEGSNCGNLGSAGGKGRYLMFPHAADQVRENNDKFSPCSISHISRILQLKKDDCFVVSDQPICGNHIVEEGEECDVGHYDTDPCCFSASHPMGVQCHLKPDKVCSPSQGLCCTPQCQFKSAGQICDEVTDCQEESRCSGGSALCPPPNAKENLTECSQGTRVCISGVCSESVCVKHGLEKCDCPDDSMKEKCHMCCQQPDQPDTCASTTSSVLSRQFQRKSLPLVGGAPCFGNEGYCDKFHVCRLLDADGPIARLKNSVLNLDEFDDLGEWMKAHWWAILVAILTLCTVMGCTVCLCGRTLDTSDLE